MGKIKEQTAPYRCNNRLVYTSGDRYPDYTIHIEEGKDYWEVYQIKGGKKTHRDSLKKGFFDRYEAVRIANYKSHLWGDE